MRSTPPRPQACRVAVEDRSAGFAHATELGAPTIAFALLKQRTTNTSARARSAEQPRTPGAFANEGRVVPTIHRHPLNLAPDSHVQTRQSSASNFYIKYAIFDEMSWEIKYTTTSCKPLCWHCPQAYWQGISIALTECRCSARIWECRIRGRWVRVCLSCG